MRYRVGQEPAFDLKRLLVAACKEAGLERLTVWMMLPGTIQIHVDCIVEALSGTEPGSLKFKQSRLTAGFIFYLRFADT